MRRIGETGVARERAMSEEDVAEIREWLERHGEEGLTRAYAIRLAGEVDRLRVALEHSRVLHTRLLAHLRETG